MDCLSVEPVGTRMIVWSKQETKKSKSEMKMCRMNE